MHRQPSSIVEILITSFEQILLKKGVAPPRAKDEAMRAVRDLLAMVGGQKWHLPRKIKEEALEVRNDAIRAAHRRGIPPGQTQRAFHIGKTRYYEIIAVAHSDPAQALGQVG
jgi:Mor family transcriptional regulator